MVFAYGPMHILHSEGFVVDSACQRLGATVVQSHIVLVGHC